MDHALVIRFADDRAAYRFVAEVRRLYDVARWPDLEVMPADGGAYVFLPMPAWALSPVRDLATRYGGDAPVAEDDIRRLRNAIDRAREEHRQAVELMRRAGTTPEDALRAVDRRRTGVTPVPFPDDDAVDAVEPDLDPSRE